jgi:hypothetical protein
MRPLKIVIDPGDMARWLKAQDLEHALEHHAHYVAWRLDRLVASPGEEE